MAQQFRQYLPDEINSENLAYYYDLVSSAHGSFYRLKQTIPQNDGVLPLLPPSFWAIQL
jgi:hypothetical protein